MNILTYDIEEWYTEKHFSGNRARYYRAYDEYLEKILAKLSEANKKATFFCVGAMGREFPGVIRKIVDAGQEIGCHSDVHTWLNKMGKAEMQEDTHRAVDSLRQCAGVDVTSFRAPAFSIGKGNPWAFEILYENGIRMDSSVFPAFRDFGGFPEFGTAEPAIVDYNGTQMKEFPICLAKIMGKEMAYSGGGYFRFFPYCFIKKEMEKSGYAISYFHINDLLPEQKGLLSREEYETYFKEPGTLANRLKRYLKANIGKGGALAKMNRLIDNVAYTSLSCANEEIDWDKVKRIKL